jgi:hypothetical protein
MRFLPRLAICGLSAIDKLSFVDNTLVDNAIVDTIVDNAIVDTTIVDNTIVDIPVVLEKFPVGLIVDKPPSIDTSPIHTS